MKCRHYEQLFFDSTSTNRRVLTQTQYQALQNHLQECPSCRELQSAWGKVEALFAVEKAADAPVPAPGFSARWKERLEKEQRIKERQQIWSALSFFLSSAAMSLSMIIVWFALSFGTPSEWLAGLIREIMALVIYLTAMQSVFSVLQNVFPIGGVFFLTSGIISCVFVLSVLWVMSLQRINVLRRIS